MNGPLKFLTARKIVPLLDLLANLNECSLARAPQILRCSQGRKTNFLFLLVLAKKRRSARHPRECSQRPFVTPLRDSSFLMCIKQGGWWLLLFCLGGGAT